MLTPELDDCLVTDLRRWPLLASCSLEQAQAAKIEWLIEAPRTCSCCGHVTSVWKAEYNYTQIFREVVHHDEAREDALRRLLDSVENALRSGLREFSFVAGSYTTMGGVVELLGRWPHKTDQLILKELRPLRFLSYRESGVQGEWLWEVSLMAVRRDA